MNCRTKIRKEKKFSNSEIYQIHQEAISNVNNISDAKQNASQKSENILKEILLRKSDAVSQIHHVVLDCCGWNYIDDSASKLLIEVKITLVI